MFQYETKQDLFVAYFQNSPGAAILDVKWMPSHFTQKIFCFLHPSLLIFFDFISADCLQPSPSKTRLCAWQDVQ